MGTLSYQNRDDAQREKLSIFGPSSDQIWSLLADEIGAKFESSGGWVKRPKVRASVGPWQVTLDVRHVSNGKTTISFTRMRAPYVNADGFCFSIHRAGVFTPIAELLGFKDIEVGLPEFDKKFVIKGSSRDQVRRLFSNPRLRSLLAAQPKLMLTVKDDEGWFSQAFPYGVDELKFEVVGVIKDIDHLKLLFELFAETLNTLCHIGSAYEDDPKIVLD